MKPFIDYLYLNDAAMGLFILFAIIGAIFSLYNIYHHIIMLWKIHVNRGYRKKK